MRLLPYCCILPHLLVPASHILPAGAVGQNTALVQNLSGWLRLGSCCLIKNLAGLYSRFLGGDLSILAISPLTGVSLLFAVAPFC